MPAMPDSFSASPPSPSAPTRTRTSASSAVYAKHPQAARLPFSLKILLENLLRTEDGVSVRAEDIEALATVDVTAEPDAGDRLHARAACCSRTSPACRPSSTSRRCATR